MTASQKERIAALRGKGATYADIADSLGLSVNTVKSYCQRNNLGPASAVPQQPKPLCEQCKKPMRKSRQSERRRFCCDACRLAWWHKHPNRLNKKALYSFICPVCHKPFTAYGNAHRVYCSRKCYGKSRRKAAAK